MAVQQIDHEAVALERLVTQFKEAPRLTGYILALLSEANELEAVFQSLLNDRWLATANGAQLDILGLILGQPRTIIDATGVQYFGFEPNIQAYPFGTLVDGSGGRFRYIDEETIGNRVLNDTEYRAFLRLAASNNSTKATPDEIIATYKFFFGENTLIQLIEGPEPATYSISIGRNLTGEEKTFISNVKIPKPAGVKLVYTGTFTATPFGFAGVPGALGFGAGTFGTLP